MQQIVSFLSRPEAYHHPVDAVKVIQTHISYVFIAKPFVYKLKKAVDFGFLNFTSWDDRKYFTFEEFRLNSRISPEIYIGVAAVVNGDTLKLIDDNTYNEDDVAAYCVKMRYIDDRYSLKSMMHELDENLLSLIAEKIYRFHSTADNSEGLQGFGGITEISKNSLENFDQIEKYTGTAVSRDDYVFMRRWTEQFIEEKMEYFKTRNQQGHVRDCHGDLHCEHIYHKDNSIIILDCIEFNKRFRYIDTISDIAFLLMDLDVNGKEDEANRLCAQYIQRSGDYDGVVMLAFYKAYRAMVRAKINSFQSDNEGLTEPERDAFLKRASDYFSLAKRYMQLNKKPRAYVVFGTIGCGKSTVAMELAAYTGGIVINSDAMRKSLCGLDVYESAKALSGQGIYSHEMTARVYEAMNEKALAIAKSGIPAIVDGTFYSKELRRYAQQFFAACNVDVQFVYVECREDILVKRIAGRQSGRSISDATVDIFYELKNTFETPGNELPHVFVINTEKTIDDIRSQVRSMVM